MSEDERLVLMILEGIPLPARRLRDQMQKHGSTIGRKTFFGLMKGLIDREFVKSWKEDHTVDGVKLNRQWFALIREEPEYLQVSSVKEST